MQTALSRSAQEPTSDFARYLEGTMKVRLPLRSRSARRHAAHHRHGAPFERSGARREGDGLARDDHANGVRGDAPVGADAQPHALLRGERHCRAVALGAQAARRDAGGYERRTDGLRARRGDGEAGQGEAGHGAAGPAGSTGAAA